MKQRNARAARRRSFSRGKIGTLLALAALAFFPMPCAAQQPEPSAAEPTVSLRYYGEIGCDHCDSFMSKDLPAAERAAGVRAESEAVDILSASGYAQCEKELAARGFSFKIFPVLVIGNNVYQGNSAIEANLLPELRYFAQRGEYRPEQSRPAEATKPEGGKTRGLKNLAIVPVAVAGLIDGINPCAFATMLFFMSWITLRGGGRKRVLSCGLAFVAGVFAAYFSIGLGVSGLLRTASAFTAVKAALRFAFAGLAAAFAVLSFVDAARARAGKASAMSLQLPAPLKKAIHKVIRDAARDGKPASPAVVVSLFFVGALVSCLELACTGQVYLPTIAYMVQTDGNVAPIAWLILYNLAFLIPLLTVLVLCVVGIGLNRVRDFFARNLFLGKIALGVLFAGLAILVWVS